MADFSAVQSASTLTDFVLSNDGKLAYISTSDGQLLRWDVEAKAFLSPISLGGTLSTLDLSPDGSYLLIGRSNTFNEDPGTQWYEYVGHTTIDRVRTDTFAVTAIDVTVTQMLRGVAQIVVVGNDKAVLDYYVAGSGSVPLRYYDALSNTVPNTGVLAVLDSSYLIPSADNRYVFIQEPLSNASMRLFDAKTGTQVASATLSNPAADYMNNGQGDISSSAKLVVNVLKDGIFVFDLNLAVVKDLSPLQSAGKVVGAQFSADGEHLLLWDSALDSLLVYETRTWTRVGTVALQSDVGPVFHDAPFGNMDVSADGRTLFLDTAAGFEIVDLQSRLSINLTGGANADTFYGSVGVDTLSGGDGNDTLRGGESNDVLSGGNGDDTIEGANGDDVIDGGAGNDTATYEHSTSGVRVDLTFTTPQNTLGAGIDTITNVENLIGSAFDDNLVGNGQDNVLSGLDGNDIFVGGAGNDTLIGGAGNDRADYGAATSGVVVDLNLTGPQNVLGGQGQDTLSGIEGVSGSAFADTLTGDAGNNFLRGMDGDDILVGGAGDDTLIGDLLAPGDFFAGNDVLSGGAGDDILVGGKGVDEATYASATGGVTVNLTLTAAQAIGGGEGSDTLSGIENLTGSAFKDVLIGDGGANQLRGLAGDDVLDGGLGADILDGGAGFDTADYSKIFSTAGVTVDLRITGQQNTGPGGVDTLISIEAVIGGQAEDVLTGDSGDNALYGRQGSDLLQGGGGNDLLNGAEDTDTASYTLAAASVSVNLSVLTAQDTGGAGVDTLVSIENLIGSAFNDILIGNGFDNLITGGDGDDIISGGLGQDVLHGGNGVDTVSYLDATNNLTVSLARGGGQDTGGAGIDSLFGFENLIGGAYHDTLTGDAGANTLVGLAGNDTLDGGAGDDRLYGGLGDDTFRVNGQGDLVFESAGEGTDTVVTTADDYLYDNIENLMLASGAGDIFGVGNGLANRIDGNEGNNLLLGGDGNDFLHGNLGDDRLFGEAGDDWLSGEAGNDQLVGGAGNDILEGGDGADSLYGEDGNDFLHGNTGVDVLVGGAGNDNLDGQNGGAGEQDLMDGGAGDDTYMVDAANDLTFEAAGGGTDTVIAIIQGGGYYLYANVENMLLGGGTAFGVGNELDNVISGNDGANWLLGGAGNDTLDGGGGNDVLFGQAGADTFGFHRIGGKFPTRIGADVVADFTPGVDKVNLAGIYSSFAEVQSHMVQNGTDSAIDLGQGDLVVFQHVAMASFTAGDFLF